MMDYIGVHERYDSKRKTGMIYYSKLIRYLILLVVMAVILMLVFYSGIWRDNTNIKSIDVSGNISLSKDEIFSFAKLNDSLISTGSVSMQIIEERILKHPNVLNVNVKNESGNIIIELQEKNPFAVIITDNKPLLMVDEKLNLYYFRKEYRDMDVPVISGLSADIDINNITKDDNSKLNIAKYIISRASALNKSLYRYISEISFSDTTKLIIFCGDSGIPVYLLDYDMITDMRNFINEPGDKKYNVYMNMSRHQLININNEIFRETLDTRILMLNSFIKKILPYKTNDASKYIDLRYKDYIVTGGI